jgi:uncharacterized protein
MLFVMLFGLLYGAMNTYVGRRTWQWLQAVAPLHVPRWPFWAVFWLLASCFSLLG